MTPRNPMTDPAPGDWFEVTYCGTRRHIRIDSVHGGQVYYSLFRAEDAVPLDCARKLLENWRQSVALSTIRVLTREEVDAALAALDGGDLEIAPW